MVRAYKHQQLLVLHQAFDIDVEDMGLRAPTIATPSLLNLVLALGFRMESLDDLTTGSWNRLRGAIVDAAAEDA